MPNQLPSTTMSGFKITPHVLQVGAHQTHNTAEDIQAELNQLQNYVREVEGWWHGIASQRFQELMVAYDRHSAALYHALQGISHKLSQAHINYHGSEEQAVHNTTAMHEAVAMPSAGANFR